MKQIIDVLLSYVPSQYRKLVPLGAVVALMLLMLFGSRYLPTETVGELKGVVYTLMAPTVVP